MNTWNAMFLSHWMGSNASAVIDDNEIWTGEQLLRRASGAVALFDRLGFPPVTAIPVITDETPAAIALAVGAALSRRGLAPLGPKMPIEDLAYAVRQLGSPYLLSSPDYAELSSQVADLAGITLQIVPEVAESKPGFDSSCNDDDPVIFVHTSGTTGRSKPVKVFQSGMVARTLAYQDNVGVVAGDRFCSASPFYHTAGIAMTMTALALGVSIIPQDRFSVEGWRRAGRLGVTWSQMVPTMVDILVSEGALNEATPRIFQYGGSPIHPLTLARALEIQPNVRFVQLFGQTEASPLTRLTHEDHLRALDDKPELLSSIGKPSFNVELIIENPDEDGVGEITVRSPSCLLTDADGWRRTGDLGTQDTEGFLYVKGRANDRIIRGGENIYPLEIENVLREHPAVSNAVVVGFPDQRWGEIIKAFIVPVEQSNPPSFDEIKSFARDRMAHFKVPELVSFIDEVPKNQSGKIIRRQLLEK